MSIKKFKEPLIYQEWFERDRSFVGLKDSNDEEIIELWDEDVTQAVEDGLLDPRNYSESLLKYAIDSGILKDKDWDYEED